MAPTEILARQHFADACPASARAAGIRIAHPHRAREGQSARRSRAPPSPTADIDLVVGTHALFQEDVAFKDLGLVVIDEQHRFGVHQRLALQAKGGRMPRISWS